MGTQPLGFAPLKPLKAYPWQAYVQPGDGHWPIPGIHQAAAASTALNRGEPSATRSTVLQSFNYMGAYSFRGLAESPDLLHLPYMVGMGLLFQVWFHPMTWLALNM